MSATRAASKGASSAGGGDDCDNAPAPCRSGVDGGGIGGHSDVTVNVGTIQGGRGVNTVPASATAEVEMRALDPDVFATAAAAVEKACARHGPWVRCTRTLTVPPWPPGDAKMKAFSRAYTATANGMGIAVVTSSRGGGSDGNWLWNTYPVLDGLGVSGLNAHRSPCGVAGGVDGAERVQSEDVEHAVWSSLHTKAALLVSTIVTLVRQASRCSCVQR